MKLVITEKPSVAQTVAKVIGAYKREDGYIEGSGYIVSWCVGHLVELAQPQGYDEKYEYSDSVAKGNIISLSKKTGDKIDPAKDRLTVTVSYGKAVTVPNFVGKSKSNILNTCYSVGLNCTFYYVGYNNLAYDTATTQNVASGRKVVSGTYVNIGLSSGPAKTYTIYIQSEWYSQSGSADNTINILRQKLNAAAPGVNFNFIKKSSNSYPPGFIHPDSPVKGPHGVNVTQGHTYTIWVTQ